MAIQKTSLKRVVSLLLMLALCLTLLPCVVSAEGSPVIDFAAKGSITVTKYATIQKGDGSTPAKKGDATGTTGDAVTDTGYTPLNGAKFVLFQIADKDAVKKYYNGTDDTSYTLDQFVYTDETNAAYNGTAATYIGTKTTAGGGTCKFENLEVGIYVLKEITAPDQITTPLAETSLISIPMVNTATSSNKENAQWIYDVSVYPKNHESTGTLELTKVDQNGSPLKDVVFELYKKEFDKDGNLPAGDWTSVTSTSVDGGETHTDLKFATDAAGKIKLENLPANLYGTQYKLEEVSAPNGYIVNKIPMYFKVNTDNTITWNTETTGDCANLNKDVIDHQDANTEGHSGTLLEIKIRNEQLSLTKEVKANGGENWKQDEQYRLDDEITFRLTAYVPNNVAELETFEIKDLPSVGITDDNTSVTVKYTDNNQEKSLTGEQFSVTVIPAVAGTNGQGFKLTLTGSGKTATAGKFIQIEYKAHMNDKAVIAGNGNGNTATLTYSKYIGGGEGTYAITDEARVYTYQYQITKYKGSVAEGNKLGTGEAVNFQLLNAEKNLMKVVDLGNGVYRLALNGETGVETMTTNAQSTILIQGLGNGTYYLKETKTIPGYNLLSEPFEITVGVYEFTSWKADTGYLDTGRTVKEYQSTAYYKDAGHTTQFEDATATANSNVINKKGFVLPQTGGMGYLLFCTVGIVLIAGGAMLIFGGRKKKIR